MPERDPLLGTVVGDRYRLLSCLGTGGFGAVYEAEHVSLDRHFAVKLLQRRYDAEPAMVRRFEREARITSGLLHPNIIQVTDFGHDPRAGTYFVMELLAGEDLEHRIRRGGPMESKVALPLMGRIVEAFLYAHSKGIVHRDAKSANVFLVNDETHRDHVKVLDFGIARLAEDPEQIRHRRLTGTGVVIGSPAYMAPEQALGAQVDRRTDIYSLGIVFYEMVTGQVPFTATSAIELLNKQIKDAPAAPSEIRPDLNVHPALELVILRCLRKTMDERYQSTEELSVALRGAQELIDSGHAAPAQILETLGAVRTSMLADGSLLAESSENEQRRIVAGHGVTSFQVGLTGKNRWKLAALMAAGLAVLMVLVISTWQLVRPPPVPESPDPVPAAPLRKELEPPPTPMPTTPPPTLPEAEATPIVTAQPTPPAVAAAPPTWPLVLTTDPAGGTFRWKDREDAALPTPGLLQVAEADEGRELVFEKPGFEARRVVVRFADVRRDGRLIVPLERVRPKVVTPKPRPEPAQEPLRDPEPKKKPVFVDDDPLGDFRR